jgi:release factor glutamine methyltransferase
VIRTMDIRTLSALLANVSSRLLQAGIASHMVEAEMIVGHVLGLGRSGIYSRPEREITADEEAAVTDLVTRRARRVPLQHVLGQCEFMSLPFTVREGVFIPRPETESLVEEVLKRVRTGGGPVSRVLDIGTGSGVVAVSLAKYLEPDFVVATDISLDALEIARANAILNQVEPVVRLVAGDGLKPFRRRPATGFDVVVCNPPYVATGEIQGLEPEVRDHDPLAALDGGPDGLRFIDGILRGIPSILKREGLVVLEIGDVQGPQVKAIFEQAGLVGVEVVKDLARRDRIVLGRRS